jgi:hypothetical protein
MARAYAVALLAVSAVLLVSVATAQTCADELPPQLVSNYSGLACSPVWNNYVLRVRSSRLASRSFSPPRPRSVPVPHTHSLTNLFSSAAFPVAVRAGQGQRAAGGALDDVQHGVGGDGVLQGRPHGGLERHGGVDGQDGARAYQAVLAGWQDPLAGGRGQGLPGIQRPRSHRAGASGQDLPRLQAQFHHAAQEPERAARLRFRHPRQRPPLHSPGRDLHQI